MQTHRFSYFALLLLLSGVPAIARQAKQPAVINGPGSTLSQAPRGKQPHTKTLPYGLSLMSQFDLLPYFRDTKCVQDSSYDRSGGNGDSGNFLRIEGSKATLSDIRGPGCIYRFWSANAQGHLRIFFDGENVPRIDCEMQDLYMGKVAPFVSPIVGHRSGGWYCFFPMPFEKSCRIEVTNAGSMYYHTEYQLFPEGTPVRSFTPQLTADDQKALDKIVDQWKNLGSDPKSNANVAISNGQLVLPAGQTKTLETLKGPGEIGAIHLKIDPADRNTLRQTVLRVYWDEATKPAIEAPVGDFFGVGFGDQRVKALPVAMTDDGYVCFWPMPFARAARFELANLGKTDISGITWAISNQKLGRPLKDAGYFHAQWHRQTTVSGEHFHILQTTGRGHYVGEHTDMQGDRGIGFLEGDEKMYADGETFPSIYGTGTEDFYTGGWYFDEGPFNLAYHGCTVKQDDLSRVSAYRYQIQDCVPFQHDLKVDIEHGGENDYPGADYSCVAYWYQDTPSHDWSPIDPAQLTPAHFTVAGAVEAENLKWSGGLADIMSDASLPAEASAGKVVEISGEHPSAMLEVKTEDVYKVHFTTLHLKNTSTKAKVVLGGSIGKSFDLNDVSPVGSRGDLTFITRLKPGLDPFEFQLPEGKPLALDYVLLEPSHKDKDVIEAESLVSKANATGGGTVTVVDGNDQWSGWSALQWQPTHAADKLTLPVHLDTDGNYQFQLNVLRPAGSPTVTLQVDNEEILESTATPGNAGMARLYFGRPVSQKSGDHTLTIGYKEPGATLPALVLDDIKIQRQRDPFTMEAEDLKVLDAKGGQTQRQEMNGFGHKWGNDAQFWFTGNSKGSEATLELPVPTAGKYKLSVYYTTARDYAMVQTLIDGKEVGPVIDCFTADVLPKGKTELGTIALTAGAHRITFRAVDKNTASSNFLIGVDAIGLEPIK